MARIDIVRLRKEKGMSQVELSRKLGLTQSYLSTIENGKYQLSAEKKNLLKQVMGLDNLDDYYIASVVERDKRDEDIVNEGDLLGQLLKKLHEHAHKENPDSNHHHDHHQRIEYLEKELGEMLDRNEALFQRNERLESKLEAKDAELEECRNEIYHLRLRLTGLGIDPANI